MFSNDFFKDFTLFDPKNDSANVISKSPGVYVMLLRPGSSLPGENLQYVPSSIDYNGVRYEVIYVGISNRGLYQRDYLTHFTGNNAGRSTLRKSLGSLMGLTKTHRSENEHTKLNPRIKFIEKDEESLSEWMAGNLLMLFKPMPKDACDIFENELIAQLNPPLNISKNHNLINSDFRRRLTQLRTDLSNFSE